MWCNFHSMVPSFCSGVLFCWCGQAFIQWCSLSLVCTFLLVWCNFHSMVPPFCSGVLFCWCGQAFIQWCSLSLVCTFFAGVMLLSYHGATFLQWCTLLLVWSSLYTVVQPFFSGVLLCLCAEAFLQCGLIGSVFAWHASSIPTYSTFFRGDLVVKNFLRPFSLFRWFKKSSCQLLAKECAVSTGELPRRLAQEQCV